jgi:hypothetical protein
MKEQKRRTRKTRSNGRSMRTKSRKGRKSSKIRIRNGREEDRGGKSKRKIHILHLKTLADVTQHLTRRVYITT